MFKIPLEWTKRLILKLFSLKANWVKRLFERNFIFQIKRNTSKSLFSYKILCLNNHVFNLTKDINCLQLGVIFDFTEAFAFLNFSTVKVLLLEVLFEKCWKLVFQKYCFRGFQSWHLQRIVFFLLFLLNRNLLYRDFRSDEMFVIAE